jgi:nucleoside-diphosphate-sugar epimerase
MRIAVAGGTGFIGGRIVAALRRANFDAFGVGRQELTQALAQRFDAWIWAAGGRSGPEEILRQAHVEAPASALRTLKAGDKFIYLSSGQVYGDIPAPFAETDQPKGSDPYSLVKLAGESLLSKEAAAGGVRLTLLRLPVVYGPSQTGPMMIPSLLEHLRQGKRFAMTPGEQSRDLLYVDDVARGTLLALRGEQEGLYNLGSGIEVAIREVAEKIAKKLGPAAEALLDIGAIPYRGSEQMRYVFNIDKARRELGFTPSVDLDEGIAATVGGEK